jgi:hypothetical protein
MIRFILCSFLHAQKRTKKGSRSLGSTASNCPVLLVKRGRLGKSLRSAEPLFLSLLRCSAA